MRARSAAEALLGRLLNACCWAMIRVCFPRQHITLASGLSLMQQRTASLFFDGRWLGRLARWLAGASILAVADELY